MNYRVTTNGLFSQYRDIVHESQSRLNTSMKKVETGRYFNRYYEDPGSASLAFQLRRSYWRTGDQIDNSNYVISKFETGFQALEPVVDASSDGSDLSSIREALSALNDTAGSSRYVLGQQMQSVADSLMRVMNVRYNDEYIFAGADGLNVPFEFRTNDDGSLTLLYRGVDVDFGKPPLPSDFDLDVDPLHSDYLLSEREFGYLDEDGLAALAEKYGLDDGYTYDDYKAAFQSVLEAEDASSAETVMENMESFAAARDDYAETYAKHLYDEPIPSDYGITDSLYEHLGLLTASEFAALSDDEKAQLGYDVTAGYASYKGAFEQAHKADMMYSEDTFTYLSDDYKAKLAELYGYEDADSYESYKEAYELENGLNSMLSEEAYDALTEDELASLGEQYDLTGYGSYIASYKEVNGLNSEDIDKINAYNEAMEEYENNLEEAMESVDYSAIASRFDETTYVDIGLGFQLDDDGSVVASSAFNSVLSGLEFLGYGLDGDGDPLNVVSLMNELGSLFQKCDAKTGAYPDPQAEYRERAETLTNKVIAAIDKLQNQHVELSAKSAYLKTNLTQLQDRKYTVNGQIEQTEQMDPADAITSMMWAQYSYNAALRIGNDVLSQSLLDYMR